MQLLIRFKQEASLVKERERGYIRQKRERERNRGKEGGRTAG